MKKIYHSIPVGVLLRIFSIILGFFVVFEAVHASPYANLNEFADYEFSIAENTASGTVIGEVSVSNAEAVTVIDGNEEGFFEINELTGELSISEGAELDYETKASFTLTVEVSTDVGTSVVVITIHLLDVGGPEAVTGEASDITEEGASLSGTFMDHGNYTVAAIQYGATAQLDDDFNPEGAEGMEEAEAGAGESSLQLHLTGLDDATTYYYRTVAKNEEGVAFGETKSFTTCTIPVVEHIAIMDQNPTNSDFVHFLVTFSEPVEATTLNENDFELELSTYENGSPLEGSIVEILPEDDEGKRYVVKVGLNDGDGSLKLIFRDDDSVESIACGVPIGGTGAENGDFEDGEIYTIDNTAPTTMTMLYTNEDVPVTYTFALSDLPDNDDNLTVVFRSLNPELIPDSESGYEFSGTGNRRKIKIIPVANKHGEGVVQVTLIDQAGNEGNTKELYIVVRAVADPPLLVTNDVSGEEDTGIPLDVAVSLADQDESEVIKSNSISISGLPSGASLSAGTDAGNGEYIFEDAALLADVEFIPPANLSGTYELTLSAISREIETDGELVARREATAAETFTVTVNPVNDEPVFALDPTELTLEEDFEEARFVNIIPGLVPADEQEQEVNYTVAPQNNEDPIANVSIGADESGNPRVVITAKENAVGTQVFIVTANDGQDENNTHEEEFTLIINPANDAPAFTLSEDRIEREEDFEGTVTVTLADESLENESDQNIVYSLSPESVDFANISIDAATGTITISSVPDGFGSQVFTVTANDGQGEHHTDTREFTLVVSPVNDAPVFTLYPEEVIVNEDFTIEETVVPELELPFPWGEEDETVSYSLRNADIDWANISLDPVSGIVTITAVENGNGEQLIELVGTDNGTPSEATYVQTFLLRVIPVNDEPVLAGALEDLEIYEDERWEYSIPEGIFTDPDGDESLTFSASMKSGEELPAWLSFDAASKTFSGTPDGPDVGEYQLLVKATEPDGASIQDDFTLTVIDVNDIPEISAIADVTVDLGDPVEPITFSISDEETAAADLIVTVATDNGTLLPESAMVLSGEGENRELLITPPFEEWGSAVVTVTVSDGEGEASSEFTFTVNLKTLALDIPDLITPNGDRANDTWNIRYLSLYENNEVRVFDRTGKMVFGARNYSENREWDGTHDGRHLPEGIYFYEIKLNNGSIKKRGTITIAR
jgi:gliding motility-associated-like protein